MMTELTLSKSEAVKFGFNTARKNLKFFIPLSLIILIIDFLPGYLVNQISEGNRALIFLINFFGGVLTTIVSIGFLKISLKFIDNQQANLTDLFSSWNDYLLVIKYWLSSVVFGLIVLLGILLLVVPGIIWAIKLQYYSFLIVEKKMGPIEALRLSWQITKGVKWQLFLLGILLGLINLLGLLALVVGLLVSIPTTMLAQTYVYRKLVSQQEKVL